MMIAKVSRRTFLQVSGVAGTGLILGACAQKTRQRTPAAMNAFVEIGNDDIVTIHIPRSEMGQGVLTSLAMIVAEELEADWKNVRTRQADLDRKYGVQNTFASASVHENWEPLRRAGASARMMLIAAAAKRWNVAPSECEARGGVVRHRRRSATYGELAADAAKLPVPKNVSLKDSGDFRIIGRSLPRVDNHAIVTGSNTYGIDVVREGMLFASVERCPVYGGSIAGVDDRAAHAVPGVQAIVRIPADRAARQFWDGVAVVASSTWAALKGREKLVIDYDKPSHVETSESYRARLLDAMSGDAIVTRRVGDAKRAFARAERVIEATYELPFVAHAAMEPPSCVVDVRDGAIEVWAPTQTPERVVMFMAPYLGVPPESIRVHVTALGGGFGRKVYNDYVLEAAYVSRAVRRPVRLMMTREDDLRHDFFRPAQLHRLRAALDERGNLAGWHHRIAGASVTAFIRGDWNDEYASDESLGAIDIPYRIPNVLNEFCNVDTPVPRGVWRSVASSETNFAVQAFLDEIAFATGKDPVALRRELIPQSRALHVLNLAAEKARWGTPLPPGRARGVALLDGVGPAVAQVAEVSLTGGAVKVHRVVCAVDIGTVINPDGVRAQIEGSIAFGLSAALHGEITIANGTAAQSNFHDYPLLTMAEMPEVEVHLVPSTAPPDGVGEAGVPPIASAVANALFVLTGTRARRLPLVTNATA